MRIPRDVIQGLRNGALIGAAVLALGWPLKHLGGLPSWGLAPTPAAHAATATPTGRAVRPPEAAQRQPAEPPWPRQLDLAGQAASPEVRRLAQWVVATADNGRHHFVVLDKRLARVYVFDAGGRLAGSSPVLLGYAAGDDTVPGIGERPIEQVRPQERTTPAGRFLAEPGRNARGEDVVWVDYDAAVSMHRVRATDPAERRLQRLASATVADNRISYGCINLPVAFFDQVVWPRFRQARGMVYVLPEVKPLAEVFPGLSTGRGQVASGDRASGGAATVR